MDRGVSWAIVESVTKSWMQLSTHMTVYIKKNLEKYTLNHLPY